MRLPWQKKLTPLTPVVADFRRQVEDLKSEGYVTRERYDRLVEEFKELNLRGLAFEVMLGEDRDYFDVRREDIWPEGHSQSILGHDAFDALRRQGAVSSSFEYGSDYRKGVSWAQVLATQPAAVQKEFGLSAVGEQAQLVELLGKVLERRFQPTVDAGWQSLAEHNLEETVIAPRPLDSSRPELSPVFSAPAPVVPSPSAAPEPEL